MIIYRPTDRIPVKVQDLTLWLSPLTYEQKTKLLSLTTQSGGIEKKDIGRQSLLSFQYSVRSVEGWEKVGAKYTDGSTVALVFDASGQLDDASVESLLYYLGAAKTVTISQCILVNVYTDKLDGISFELDKVNQDKKKP